MNRVFNPFRYIAGGKALAIGVVCIVASSLMLYSGGMIQDSFLHIGYADASLLKVFAVQCLWWLAPAMLLYLSGLAITKSKIRIIDILGTTAFAQIILLMIIAPMLLPAVQDSTTVLLSSLQSGTEPATKAMISMIVYGIWTTFALILYYIWNYNAFAVSCNVKGSKAILLFILVQVVLTIVSNIL